MSHPLFRNELNNKRVTLKAQSTASLTGKQLLLLFNTYELSEVYMTDVIMPLACL